MTDSSAPRTEQLRFAPYAQLVKMLVPSAGAVSLYGAADELLWCSDGCERPDLRTLVAGAARERAAGDGPRGAIERVSSGASAFVTALEDGSSGLLGHLVVELSEDDAAGRYSMIASLLRPVVEALQSRLALEQGQLLEQDPAVPARRGFDAFAQLLDDDDTSAPAVIARFLDSCVESMPARIAAVVVPDAGLASVACADDLDADAARAAVDATRHELAAELAAQDSAVVARPSGDGVPSVATRLLASPVRDAGGRVQGFLALYRDAGGADFDDHDTALLDYLGRKISMLLNRRHDPLTGLMTRDAFERRAQAALDAASGREALVYIDVDHLHQVNEALGFECGDRVLAFVAARMRSVLGPDALAGRIGGDRFAVMLPGTDLDGARTLAQRLQAALAASDYEHGDRKIPVTLTIGVAATATRSIRHLVAAAELASKRAKSRGPGRIATSRPAQARPTVATEELAYRRFEDALADNALALEAQPITGLDGRAAAAPLGFEILVRMRNEAGEWMSAHRFMKAAEHYGMLPAIDRWVFGETLAKLDAFGAPLPELPLGFSVNVSAQSLGSADYERYVLDALNRAELPAGLLGFELKESDAWRRIAHADRFIRALSAAGARIALDNFGSGTGSIAQLRALPIGHVKIDGALLRRTLEDAESSGLVGGLTRAARGLGIATVAEQVETRTLAAALESLGVDFAQGYYFGHPAPLEEWLARLGDEAAPELAAAR